MEERKGLHVGIIPDGSRRWARLNKIRDYNGKQSGEAVERIVRHIFGQYPEIWEVSIWALSIDNLKRSAKDRELVYALIEREIKQLSKEIETYKRRIKVNFVGTRFRNLPETLVESAEKLSLKTRNNKQGVLNICAGYSGKQEIIDAFMSASRWFRKNPAIKKIHEGFFERFLMIPRPLDIVIRTGGEKRLSGFMLYQIEYAELFFIDTLWPDFSTKEFDEIMEEFKKRNRRFGK